MVALIISLSGHFCVCPSVGLCVSCPEGIVNMPFLCEKSCLLRTVHEEIYKLIPHHVHTGSHLACFLLNFVFNGNYEI